MSQKQIFLLPLLIVLSLLILTQQQTVTPTSWSLPIAYGRTKWIGCTILDPTYEGANWARYWNQATPEYLGQWSQIQTNQDSMNWAGVKFAHDYAKTNGIPFKEHTLLWYQDAWNLGWLMNLDNANRKIQIQQWIQLYCQQFPDTSFINVVNEAVHGTPFYADAIGGAGVTGYDWIVWAFNRTRTYCPNSKLHINDYDIIGFSANTTTYVNIIKALIANVNGTGSLIDGIGEQGHNYESTDVNVLKTNLAILASLGLPIHITEFDLDIADDTQHLNRFKTLFPIFYEYPQIQGVTVWGYLKGRTYKSTTWLYDPNGGTAASPPALAGQRLALQWLKYTYIPSLSGTPTGPVATFYQTTTGLSVSLNGSASTSSTGTISSYAWNLGNGISSTGAVISYTYPTAGTYNVTLTITDSTAATASTSQWITVTAPPPPAGPSASFTTSQSGLTVNVDGSSSTSSASITSYSYNFGDGNVKTGSSPTNSNTYSKAGQYIITLTITDANGKTNSLSKTITITSLPNPNFTFTTSGLTANVDASSSSDTGSTISTYNWNFGDGSSGTGVTTSHTYSSSNSYYVSLTVTDALGVQVSVSKQVTVVKSAIQANFTLTVQGLKVSVDGSLSVGTITKYSYNFGPATKSGATTTNTYTYSTAGNYTITLTVTDSTGSTSSYSQTAYLSNPTSSFIASSSQGTASFDASASTDLYPISKYAWSFGDGTTGSGKTPKHVYAAAGTYTVALTVTDTFNNSASTSKTVTITIAAAKCSIACVTNYMQVFCYYNGTLQNQLSNYVWNWGDGTTSNDILLATHTYNVAGTLTVNLTVNYIGSTLSCTAKPVIKTTSLVYPVPAWYGGQSGLTLSINFYGWTTNGKSINSVSWNFGDGTTSTVTSPTHTYATSGIYAVVCTVVDSAGVSATAVQVYNFTSLPVSVSVGAMTKYTVGYPIQFAYTDVLVVDNLGNPVGNVQVQSSLQSQGANLYQSPVATTDATGWTTLKSTSGAANLVFSICVNNLVYSGPAPSLWYNQSGNKAQCL